jgi:hypothetical protein
MIEVQTRLQDPRALVMASKLLAFLDKLDIPSNLIDTESIRMFSEVKQNGLISIQKIANEYLPIDLKFNYLAPQAKREKQLASIAEYFRTFKFP